MLCHMKTVFECSCGYKTRQLAKIQVHNKEHRVPATTSTCSACVFITKDIDNFIEKYNLSVKFEHNNTVGAKSISKQEFIKEINKIV